MTGTANSVNGPEAAPYLAKAGGTMTGALNMGSHLINSVTDPVSNQDAATMAYVLSVAQGRVFKDPCSAASTVALTATYANGASGVGATLTNAGAQVAFAIDGYTAALTDRILIKNQASTFQNGIYTVTTLGSGASNWVLTRATDMDQPSEFKSGTTFIIGGTLNAGRTYTETATVTTVGTDAVTFVLSGDAQQTVSVVAQTFTSNGTYTPTTGMFNCIVEAVGGGGGGGGATGAVGQSSAAAGGAGGGYARKVFTSATIGASQTVTIGAGGAGALGDGATGTTGGTTTLGSTLLQATGGAGGEGGSSTATIIAVPAVNPAAVGGVGTLGDLNVKGNGGDKGIVLLGTATNQMIGGAGGASHLGGGANSPSAGVFDGIAGGVYGGGGSGAVSYNNNGAKTGGAGAAGVIIITEYVLV